MNHSEIERRLVERLAPWTRRAASLVARRVGDARAQAGRGRIDDATARLSELHLSLAGADGSGVIGDARAAFYRHAFGLVDLDPAIHRRLSPDADGESVGRTHPIAGRNLPAEAERLARTAAIELRTIAATSSDGRETALDAWETTHRDRLARWAHGALSDSQMGLTHAVERLHVRPELIQE